MEKHQQAVKRFGVRYGRTVKKRLGLIEAQQRKKHQCPYCHYTNVKRKSAGIWNCSKCDVTFTSRAYTVSKPAALKAEHEEV